MYGDDLFTYPSERRRSEMNAARRAEKKRKAAEKLQRSFIKRYGRFITKLISVRVKY